MLFGHTRNFSILSILFGVVTLVSCNNKVAQYITFKAPFQGESIKSGKLVKIELDIPADTKVDGVTYLIDGKEFAVKSNKDTVMLNTNDLALGYRLITAIVSAGNKKDTITNNIVLKTDKQPIKLSYTVVNTFPHDTSAYTQGLTYTDGSLLESTGRKGFSVVKYVDIKTGKTIKQAKLADNYFGEGSFKLGNKIIVLTWQEMVGIVYDATTLTQISTFPYQNSTEGWGLTFNGKSLLKSDGTNKIWSLDPITFKEESSIEVYDNNGPVNSLNELEYIKGKIYANVYGSHKIVVINPQTGAVEAELDLKDLIPHDYFKTEDDKQNNVLNGIAVNPITRNIYVTGKKWPELFEIVVK